MSEKAKRKGNPRRRLLLQLLFIIVIVSATISAIWWLMQPSDSEMIMYTTYETDNLLSLHGFDLDNPNDVTTFFESERILPSSLRTVRESSIITYVESLNDESNIWMLDTATGERVMIGYCECKYALLDESETWLAYVNTIFHRETWDTTMQVIVQNIRTSEKRIIHDELRLDGMSVFAIPVWLPDSPKLRILFDGSLVEYHTETNVSTPIPVGNFGIARDISPDGNAILSFDNRLYLVRDIVDTNSDSDSLPEYVDGIHLAWHPTRQEMLLIVNPDNSDVAIALYYWEEDRQEIIWEIIGSGFLPITDEFHFNNDGSLLLYRFYNTDTKEYVTIVRDMATGEETAIPIEGDNPMFVGG